MREVFTLAVGTARMTHHHPSGYLSAGVLAAIVRSSLDGADLPSAVSVARAELVRWDGHSEQTTLLDKVVCLGVLPPEEIESELGGGGDTVPEAWLSVLELRDVAERLCLSW
ncbi:hypothetical protein BBK82_15755 [Lentzea guizhouensis]|uniref:Uncharacterized protein n=1 Tax=Lentzea guizhouensis TaxID=1586287 RepID=A0A1B2HHW2_9PSEU|nr:ADP-ribosylglycohydrolase family protein [Lentzea guizhouensis]ANZ37297.1 hypothetical protein BBK82_15755 [Lentzea guizhouensis]